MGICAICGKEVLLPYTCSYCNLTFCGKHRLPENHQCTGLPKRGWRNKLPDEEIIKIPVSSNTITSQNPKYNLYASKLKQLTHFLPKKISVRTIFNIAFLLVISLPVLDSVQLMWDSPLTFSRTFLPKWWDLFPSEYPIPSINLLYLYFGMLGLFVYTVWKFISKRGYGTYEPRRLKMRKYYYVIIVGATFLYFFSEANFFWLYSIQKLISNFRGGL